MKKIIHLTLFLAIVSALAGVTLSYVNGMTSPIIEERQAAAVKASLQEIFPNASNFTEINFTDESGLVSKVYSVEGAGYAFNVSVQGYKDIISYIVGVDSEGTVVGFIVTLVNDTPGLGTKIAEQAFRSTVEGKLISGKFDTIAGSTISSSAVTKGLASVSAVLESLK